MKFKSDYDIQDRILQVMIWPIQYLEEVSYCCDSIRNRIFYRVLDMEYDGNYQSLMFNCQIPYYFKDNYLDHAQRFQEYLQMIFENTNLYVMAWEDDDLTLTNKVSISDGNG